MYMKKFIIFCFVVVKACGTYPAFADEVYFTKGKDCESQIIKRIQSSKDIKVAMYILTNKNIKEALITAIENDATVTLVLDRVEAYKKYSASHDLLRFGANIRISNKQFKIQHNKIAIFDNTSIVAGSYNWTEAASNNNSEDCLFYDSNKEVINKYLKRFEYLYSISDEF